MTRQLKSAQRYTHHDAQDDRVEIVAMQDMGVGPMVIFDAGGFTDPDSLRAYADDLIKASLWLAEERTRASYLPTVELIRAIAEVARV